MGVNSGFCLFKKTNNLTIGSKRENRLENRAIISMQGYNIKIKAITTTLETDCVAVTNKHKNKYYEMFFPRCNKWVSSNYSETVFQGVHQCQQGISNKSETREGLNAHKGESERIGRVVWPHIFLFLEIMGGCSSWPDNLISVTFSSRLVHTIHSARLCYGARKDSGSSISQPSQQ